MPPLTLPLILGAAQIPEYRKLIDDAVAWARSQSSDRAQQILDASDKLAVNIGLEILKLIPGRISTEVDARLPATPKRLSRKPSASSSCTTTRASATIAF